MIARVFARKTNVSPVDQHAYYDVPGLFTPRYERVYVSVVFTWDIERGKYLAECWRSHADEVLIGGPAFGDPGGEFTPGMFLREGVTITSRGCPNSCGFCFVPKREGGIRELEVKTGNIVQDNNLLACSDGHIRKVFQMLKTQRGIQFKGGFEAARITDKIADELTSLRIQELWIACDHPGALNAAVKAISVLRSRGFQEWKIRCYVLIGRNMEEEHERLIRLVHAGCRPFAQLYQDEQRIEYGSAWKAFERKWARPAAYMSAIKKEEP